MQRVVKVAEINRPSSPNDFDKIWDKFLWNRLASFLANPHRLYSTQQSLQRCAVRVAFCSGGNRCQPDDRRQSSIVKSMRLLVFAATQLTSQLTTRQHVDRTALSDQQLRNDKGPGELPHQQHQERKLLPHYSCGEGWQHQ